MNQRTTEAAEAAIRLPGARDPSYTAAEGEEGIIRVEEGIIRSIRVERERR